MNSIKAWIKASRLQSQSYIFLSVLFGQAWFVYQGNELNWPIFIVMSFFCLFDQLFIVYANDFADYETDCKNNTFNIFSGGSRVLADKDLVPAQLKKASLLMTSLCLACGFFLTVLYQRSLAIPLVVSALMLLWIYSYKPFKLSYLGGGEFLQMAGVGIILPFFGYYAQSGTVLEFPWMLMLVILPTQLACAMATSLSDEPSDKLSKKKTMTVLLGQKKTKRLIILLNIISMILFPYSGWIQPFNIEVFYILLVPGIATFIQLFITNCEAGSAKLTLFVFLSVLVTLSLMGGMAISLLA